MSGRVRIYVEDRTSRRTAQRSALVFEVEGSPGVFRTHVELSRSSRWSRQVLLGHDRDSVEGAMVLAVAWVHRGELPDGYEG